METFPFDLLLTSRIYGWITLLSLRSSYQDMLRSHIYPATVANLPWSENLPPLASALEALRQPFFDACRARYDAGAELQRRAATLDLAPLKTVFKTLADKDARLDLSPEFDSGDPATVANPILDPDDPCRVMVSDDGYTVTLPDNTLAGYVLLGLRLAEGEDITKTKLLGLPIPQNDEAAHALADLITTFDPLAVEAQVDARVDEIDRIVGAALGLTADEIAFIQTDMRTDPFLSRVRPRYPYFTPAQRGRRTSLESARRYG